MLNETRVNLKHLLEDIRDSYTAPLEEVIITELIANALDSKAYRIDFTVNPENGFLRCIDNGLGMKRPQLKEYHNIASSAKQKGQGIGFAGVGAKLSLLLAERVVTESRGGYGSRAATEWYLSNPYRAPWKFIPSNDLITGSRGTAITIFFSDRQTHLLKSDFVRKSIVKHFYSLFHDKLQEQILRYVYKKPIEFVVNGELLTLSETEQRTDRDFKVYWGKSKKPIGAGFLTKNVLNQSWLKKLTDQKQEENSLAPGLSISTFGKIIKSGWEWLGILPKNHGLLNGVVEIPALSMLLTTNKNDFLTDSTHLKQYYKIRKSIQEAVLPILKSLGEYEEMVSTPPDKKIKPLTKQIENALGNLTEEFPELIPLLGSRRKIGASIKDDRVQTTQQPPTPANVPMLNETVQTKPTTDKISQKITKNKNARARIRKPGLTIILEELKDAPKSLGRIVEDTVSINTLHPAWPKALQYNQQEYHILLTVGLVLSEFLAPDKHPQKFLEDLLASWGKLDHKPQTKKGQNKFDI
ncbi:MAG: ATP-binding protein [Candidatus Taylorbacteria bacterium]|nr:ATP-binding protein [Candidatus Taylorbacteria bacterium]